MSVGCPALLSHAAPHFQAFLSGGREPGLLCQIPGPPTCSLAILDFLPSETRALGSRPGQLSFSLAWLVFWQQNSICKLLCPRSPCVGNRQYRMALAEGMGKAWLPGAPLSPLTSEATLGDLLSWPPAHPPPAHGPVGSGLSSEQLVSLAAWAHCHQACPLELGGSWLLTPSSVGGPCSLQPPHTWGPSGLPVAPSGSPHPALGGPPDLSISRVTVAVSHIHIHTHIQSHIYVIYI